MLLCCHACEGLLHGCEVVVQRAEAEEPIKERRGEMDGSG